MAYAILGTAYHNLGEKVLSAQNTRKAYDLRNHVSEWEKFYIESHYHHFVTGDLDKARQTYELWSQIYPRERVAPMNLGVVYQTLGQHGKSLAEFREAQRLAPSDSLIFDDVVLGYIHLNRFDEARATANEALTRNLDSAGLRFDLYQLAFLKNDLAGMEQQISWSSGRSGKENIMLSLEASTAAYVGKMSEARGLSRQAATSAARAGEKEMAAGCEAAAALWEALYGNAAEARQHASSTLAESNGRDAQYVAALALALIGDAVRAQALADDLEKRFPEDTIVRFNYLPTVRAESALHAPAGAAKAIEILGVTSPFELGVPGSSTFWTNLYPVYVRGEALLALRAGTRASAEFQKIVDSPGVVVNEPIGALAHLGLARSYAVAGDVAKSRAAYDDFFTGWKDADSTIPVLRQARAEYARLQ
jgi:tetratricopeptide (TPR) repeat protein